MFHTFDTFSDMKAITDPNKSHMVTMEAAHFSDCTLKQISKNDKNRRESGKPRTNIFKTTHLFRKETCSAKALLIGQSKTWYYKVLLYDHLIYSYISIRRRRRGRIVSPLRGMGGEVGSSRYRSRRLGSPPLPTAVARYTEVGDSVVHRHLQRWRRR
jgi:hypothetical protein